MHQRAGLVLRALRLNTWRFGKGLQGQEPWHPGRLPASGGQAAWGPRVGGTPGAWGRPHSCPRSPPARDPPSRSFSSYEDHLRAERRNVESLSLGNVEVLQTFRRKIEETHDKFSCDPDGPEVRFGDFVYREEDGCILRFKPGDADGDVEVLLHPEDLSPQPALVQRIRISQQGNYLAASLKILDSEESACVIVRLGQHPAVEDLIPGVSSFEWASDDVLFHTRQRGLRCHDVFRSSFGSRKHSEPVFREQDPRFFVDLYRTKDRRFVTVNSNSKTMSEVWLVDCRQPWDPPVLVQKRLPGVLYHVEHSNDELYVVTTFGEPAEYKLMKTPVAFCGVENWQLVHSTKEKTKLVDLEMFEDHCVLFLKHRSQFFLNVVSLRERSVQSVTLPAWACACHLDPQPEPGGHICAFQLSSPVEPPRRFLYGLLEGRLWEQRAPGEPGATRYRVGRFEAKSKDGTLVPVTVLHKADAEDLRRKPLLIHVYGAYGADLDMSFKAEKLMLVEDGWILAYCHVRGGGELGLGWHHDGRLQNKLNGLADLQACIALLHERGMAEPRRTALAASSAGGLLAGALCNASPQLLRAVALHAPFLDLVNTMLDPRLPLTVEEQEEWGDPLAGGNCLDYLKSYCPYHNIKPQRYPAVRITAYENDQRIPLEGLLRYTQSLREAVRAHGRDSATGGGPEPTVILDVRAKGSHCIGAWAWDDTLNEVAAQLAFLYQELGLRPPPPTPC
ncbi:prolyl endopeptidase-like isoform X2 [Ornithorhynchus anatinus]|uniref:prolyl endopeptidase-like isoform X2 n=1 Tax=Ornithorhynchus anatinus TaxID=9258 RepID=UPI0010A78AE7|nr:prolyl endopeptidase-like isoform X2 [Ornithorhynchus anatinus]